MNLQAITVGNTLHHILSGWTAAVSKITPERVYFEGQNPVATGFLHLLREATDAEYAKAALGFNLEVGIEYLQLAPMVSVSSNPRAVPQAAQFISEHTALSELAAEDFILVVSERSHHFKLDIYAPCEDADFEQRLGCPKDSRLFVGWALENGARLKNHGQEESK